MYFEQVYVEKSVIRLSYTREILKKLKDISCYRIDNYRDVLVNRRDLDKKTLVLARHKGASFVKCPGTKKHICCNYYVLDVGFNCLYNCTYCYLHQYANVPFQIIYTNIEEIFDDLNKKHGFYRIGTGEFTDSLALDCITDISQKLIRYFAKKKNFLLELKTKSVNIDNVLKLSPPENVVLSWSVNTDKIARREELGAPDVVERIKTAGKCQRKGYKIGLHFDPLIYYDKWEKDYTELVELIFRYLAPQNIALVSLGALRFNRGMYNIIKNKFPGSLIIYEELITGSDDKLRYFKPIRIRMFKKVLSALKSHYTDLPVYLCMESADVWKKVFGRLPGHIKEIKHLFTAKNTKK